MIGVPIIIAIARAHRSMDLSSWSVIAEPSHGKRSCLPSSSCLDAFQHPNASMPALRASYGF
jgi:hypothetical protein